MANNIKGITIELGGNAENLNSSLKGVNKTAGDLQSELKQVQRQLKFNPGNTELLNQKAKILKESISATEQKLKDLKSVQGQVEEQFKNGDLGEEKYRAFQREVEQTEDKLKSLKKQAADFGSVAGQKFQIAGEKIQNTGEKISGVGQKFMPVSAAAAGAGIAAVKMADDFESGMAKVSTIADTTQVPIGKLKQSVMDLSDQTGISTTELTEGLYQTISAGVQTKDAMNVLGVAVKTAKGGFTDTSTAINTLTSAMNAYHMKASDAAKVSDTLIATQNVGKTTVGELGQSLGNVIPTAAAAGVKFTDLMGSIAELTKQGMPTSEAITGIKTAISNVIKPSADASKEAAKLGLDFSEAHMKNVGLPAFLQEVQNKTGGNITTMGKLFGSVEGLNAVTALTGKNQKDFAKTLDSVGKSAGTTNQAFGKMESTGAISAEKAMNSMKNAVTKLGEALAPLAEKIAGLITQIGQKLQKLTPAQQQMIAKVLLLTAALAPVLVVGGQIVQGIGHFTDKLGTAIGAVSNFGKAMKESQGLFAALKVSLGPGGIAVLIIAAIALLVVGIKHLWDTNKQFRDGVMSIWNGIKGFFTGIPGFFAGLWSKISGFFSRIPAFFKSLGNGIKSGANGIKSGVVGAFNGVKSGVLSVINGIKTGVTTAFNGVKTAVLTVWNGIRTAVMTVVHLLVKGVLNICKSLSPGLHTIMSGIKNMLSAAWTIIKNVVLAPVLLICDLITGN
ncbi:MAG: phage tail tape measure protein, partial [Oscillospiraceae bacterium]|nr:phage tail tape measure protein [Oscillospiraceae bacterium]